MPTIYEYVRHPRAEELKREGPVKTADMRQTDHQNPIIRLNNKIGLRTTLIVGTMWAAYIFTILALLALPDAIKQGTYYIVVWLSSSFLQLVLLPIIIVGQNIQAAAADKRAEETYKDAEAVLTRGRGDPEAPVGPRPGHLGHRDALGEDDASVGGRDDLITRQEWPRHGHPSFECAAPLCDAGPVTPVPAANRPGPSVPTRSRSVR